VTSIAPKSPSNFERAILWVSHPDLVWHRVGGMRVIERQLFTAARAGVKSLWIGAHEPEAAVLKSLRLPPGMDVRWIAKGSSSLVECEPPYLGISSDHFIRVDTLAHIARQRYAESVSFNDASDLGVVQAVPTREDTISRSKQTLPEGSYRRLESPLAAEETITWLMAAGPKSADGFMARYFDRHISMGVSRRLIETAVTPNMMTVFSTVLGLIGAACFLGGARPAYVAGSLLVWLHSVLDGCDGELARVRFQESPFGSDLDFWGDNLVHVALFSCIGLGLAQARGTVALALGAVAVLVTSASAWAAWQHRLRRRAAKAMEAGVATVSGDGFESKLARLENSLAQRDFIYLLIVLALIDRVYEFLWATAIGGVLFFCVMMYLRRVNQHEQARQPHPAR
jgi:phosphatidylglycerophosphate synthase